MREWPKWQQLLIIYINIVSLQCYPWESQIYSNNYQALSSSGNSYNCIHTYACMLTFCVTEIIYYIINSSHAFIKSTNMIYHNCLHQGGVYNINQICQWHILIPKPLKCVFMHQLKFAIITYIVSNIYRNINKFLPNKYRYLFY